MQRKPAAVAIDVLDRARQGDQAAFEQVFSTYQPALLRYLRTLNRHIADDVASLAWESAARSLDRFEGDGDDFRAWIFTIARRRFVDETRRVARRPERPDGTKGDWPDPPSADEQGSGPDWAAAVLSQIPARQAEVVWLRVVAGLSVSEVATLLGVREGNVRAMSHRGLKAIERILSGAGQPEGDEEGPQISLVV